MTAAFLSLARLRGVLVENRTRGGFFLAGVFLALAEPTAASLVVGAGIVVLGEAVRTWASGYIFKGKRLARYGPYAHIRHPLYMGSFLMGLGICVMGMSPIVLALYAVLFAVVYLPIMKSEEERLAETFGADYASYKRDVPLLYPRLTAWPLRGKPSEDFRWASVWRNKEYEAWAGIACVTAILGLKYLAMT